MKCCKVKSPKILDYDPREFECLDKFYYSIFDIELLELVNEEQRYVIPSQTNNFKGFAMTTLRDENFNPLESSILLVDGTRLTPRNPNSNISQNIFQEILTIKFLNSKYDTVHAQSVYNDNGSGYITKADTEYFSINGASGRFKDATPHVKIVYDNEG